jgi:hypothetical protein
MEAKEDVKYIFFYSYFIDHNNIVQSCNKSKYKLNNDNVLTKEELYSLIQDSKNKIKRPTKIVSLLVHNNYTEPYEIDINDNNSFVYETNALNEITFNKTKKYLSKLNSLHVFFKINKINLAFTAKSLKSNNKKTKKNLYLE